MLHTLVILALLFPTVHLLGKRVYQRRMSPDEVIRGLTYGCWKLELWHNDLRDRWQCAVTDDFEVLEEYTTKCYNNWHDALKDAKLKIDTELECPLYPLTKSLP